jgi:hypothetical protein
MYPIIDDSGTKRWYNDKHEYHRIDGPAVEFSNGDCHWYKNDIIHRENGPAIEFADGSTEWWFDGKLHRLDGPAKEYRHRFFGRPHKEWWVNGNLHRLDGPAVEEDDYQLWFVNDELHRLDGPAIVRVNGSKEWYIYGGKIDCKDNEEFSRIVKMKVLL